MSSAYSCSDYVPPFTATCLQCLLEEGADVAGMSKMDEFGMGYVSFLSILTEA